MVFFQRRELNMSFKNAKTTNSFFSPSICIAGAVVVNKFPSVSIVAVIYEQFFVSFGLRAPFS
jgi:hypothetical protein